MKRLFLLLCVAVFLLCSCSMSKEDGEKVQDLDFTVVQEAEIPPELLSLIEEKKTEAMKHTWTNGDYLYVIIGYGEQKTSGYSIAVNEFYLGKNAIYVDTSLIGPSKEETVNETLTYPYIVIKTQKREEPVVFR
ncbi:MAG: protease complex subunit PrcB family protein [Lachnospiraceae bacterium]|nr:protease complex subunit PrcB family protein [Lachnospiraceae bacterium]